MEPTGGIWRCEDCSTVNDQTLERCMVCGVQRPAGQTQASPSTDTAVTQPAISPVTPTGSWTTEGSKERAETLQQGKPAAPKAGQGAKPGPPAAGRPSTSTARAPSRPAARPGPATKPGRASPPPPTYPSTPGPGYSTAPPPPAGSPTYSPPAPRPRGARGTSIWVGVGVCILATLLILAAVAGGADEDAPSAAQTTSPPETSPPTQPTAAPGVPISGEESASTWIAQLQSIPTSASDATVRKAYRALDRNISGVRLLRSDDFESLRAGYWVIYYPGEFADGQAAVDFCRQHGRDTRDLCVGRYLSHDRGDLQLQVYP
jgi:eukaryotic-like serine/threonine-protein kinase